ncbi:MAG: type II toxin-antitoxin system prevent-host-death family antitoxin [Treponema sp.]|nr:type II toxin-antitoxin system prevent-host-death family antitoxin [Treponema sp.]
MECQEIGAYEAKTHFSQVLDRVAKGTEYIVSKRGKPVAKIIPIEQEKKMTRKEAINALIELRKQYRGVPGDFNIREAIEDGRR